MNKRIMSIFLCVMLLIGTVMPVYADTKKSETATDIYVISTVDEFLTFSEKCRLDSFSKELYVSLEADLDLSGTGFASIPVFSGTFDGKNHMITGLEISQEGSALGLFRYLTSAATVKNLRVQGDIQPEGSRGEIGGIAGQNEGYILNCTFSGNISGANQIGGIAGINTVTGIIEDCQVTGEIHGDHFVGGIAGENDGVIRICANRSEINITAQQNEVKISDITLDTMKSSESADTVTDVGGIAGLRGGVIRECINYGNVGYKHMGYNIGGIAGTQSGYIVDCFNYADIEGRKEVGGIVGQMEPVSYIEYSEDTLQILQGQLETMSALTNQASANAQNSASSISGQIGTLMGQVQDAKNAVNMLVDEVDLSDVELPEVSLEDIELPEVNLEDIELPEVSLPETDSDSSELPEVDLPEVDLENPELPDAELPEVDLENPELPEIDLPEVDLENPELPEVSLPEVDVQTPDVSQITSQLPDADRIKAAQNSLSNSMNAMQGTLSSIGSSVQGMTSILSRDMQAISEQVSVMSSTISNASENLGGSVNDVSDQDTSSDITGKVQTCVNYGDVLADMNVGGIAGAMAMENDLDILEDWETIGEDSLNFQSEVRAVILACHNEGTVTARKQNAGGIVGWQPIGLVKNSLNTGSMEAEGADYVGGVSGNSTGFIRKSYAKCEITGSTYVGGIAGSATIVSNCCSMVLINEASEKVGAILGMANDDTSEEKPITKNYYLVVAEDIGGIDGISYAGVARSLKKAKFLAVENLPEHFQQVTLHFVFEDGTEENISVAPGEDLDISQVPDIPEKEGYVGEWEGLEEDDLSNVVFDKTYEVVYNSYEKTIESEACRENGKPVLLVQGTFTSKAEVALAKSDASPVGVDGAIIEVWDVSLSENDYVTAGRYLIPEDCDAEHLQVYVCGLDGTWKEASSAVDGSYLVFTWDGNGTQIAVTERDGVNMMLVVGIAGIVIVLILAGFGFTRKKKNKK